MNIFAAGTKPGFQFPLPLMREAGLVPLFGGMGRKVQALVVCTLLPHDAKFS